MQYTKHQYLICQVIIDYLIVFSYVVSICKYPFVFTFICNLFLEPLYQRVILHRYPVIFPFSSTSCFV